MERRDAGRQRRERRRVPRPVDAEDRARSIADEQRPVRRERETARHPEIVRERFGRSVVRHAVHDPLEAARRVESSFRIDSHRRRVDDARRERFARAVRPHAEDRHGHLLPPRPAVGHVEIAVAIEHGVVDLVQAGGVRGCDVDERRFARRRRDADRRAPPFHAGRDHDVDSRRRRGHDPGALLADADLGWQRFVDRESGAFDGDAAAFNRAQRMNGGHAGGH